MSEWDDLILVGIVARTHGNKGEVIVNPHSDFVAERFRAGATMTSRLGEGEPRIVEITTARVHQGRPVIGIAGIGSISEAETLQGTELRIDAAEQQALPAGQYYHHQLIGCVVETAAGETIGRVVAIEGEMGRSRLVVEGPRRRVEIPLVDEFCRVDVETRAITVTLPEGLLDV